MWLVAISLFHDAPHIGWVQDLVKVELADVVCEPLFENVQDLLAATFAAIHHLPKGILKGPAQLHHGHPSPHSIAMKLSLQQAQLLMRMPMHRMSSAHTACRTSAAVQVAERHL